jgi:membrane associated rhomboid family serine protease/Zn-finger nucleic acid-binding protein
MVYCPCCTYPLVMVEYQDKPIHHCNRCQGTLVEAGSASTHLSPWAEPSKWRQDLAQCQTGDSLPCPLDNGRMDAYRVSFDDKSVVVDHCGECGSLWLDSGEGQTLASIVESASAERAASAESAESALEDEFVLQQDAAAPKGAGSYLFQLFTGLPVEVWNPVRRRPVAVHALVLLMSLLFLTEIVLGTVALVAEPTDAGKDAIASEWMRVRNLLVLTPAYVLEGKYLWTFITGSLLHGGLFHLLGNCYFFWVFGDNVEDRIGPKGLVLLFFASGIVGDICYIAFTSSPTISVVGASGCVAGLMGAYLVLFSRTKLWMVFFFVRWRVPIVVYLGFWVAMNLAGATLGLSQVAWVAHLGGFVMGLLGGGLILYRESRCREQKPHPDCEPSR